MSILYYKRHGVTYKSRLFNYKPINNNDHLQIKIKDDIFYAQLLPQSEAYNSYIRCVSKGITYSLATNNDYTSLTTKTLPATSDTWVTVAYGNGTWIVFTASTAKKIFYSTDNGTSWTQSVSALPLGQTWHIAYCGGSAFAAVTNNSTTCMVSTNNGVTWTAYASLPATVAWGALFYGNGVLIAVCGYLTYRAAYSTNNGVTWTNVYLPTGAWVHGFYGNGKYCIINNSNSGASILISTNGTSWTEITSLSNHTWFCGLYGNNHYVIVGSGGYSAVSNDLTSWDVYETSAQCINQENGTFFNGTFFIKNDVNNILYASTNGSNWEQYITTTPSNLRTAVAGNGIILLAPYNATSLNIYTLSGD